MLRVIKEQRRWNWSYLGSNPSSVSHYLGDLGRHSEHKDKDTYLGGLLC